LKNGSSRISVVIRDEQLLAFRC